jgi:hypothetical protein
MWVTSVRSSNIARPLSCKFVMANLDPGFSELKADADGIYNEVEIEG